MKPISTGDKVRIALIPLHIVVGGVLLYRFAAGPRTPMVALVGALFVAFGVYRLVLVRRALSERSGGS